MSRNWLKQLASTKQKSRRTTQRSFRPQVEAMESRLVLSQFFEAETAELGGVGPYDDGGGIHNYPRVEDVRTSGQTNYDGPGYVNMAYGDDSMLTWRGVVEDQAGDYTLAFRYSMNTYYTGIFIPARPMGLMVNGTVITRALDFEATGDSTQGVDPWSIWADLPYTVHLNAGVNTIELFATDLAATGANPHLDSLTITPAPAGVAPAAPTNLTPLPGVGDVDLYWTPSAIASSYNIYRSTSSGTETLIASGVTASYFFDTGLASDGTSYFYRVTAVNSAGESASSNEASAIPSAPAGLLFSDDFSNGPSSAWTFTPDKDYWLLQVGLLTDAKGDTVANVPQTATVALPAGVSAWQADLLSLAGHGAAIDRQGNHGISGIVVQSPDGANSVAFNITDGSGLYVGTTVNGAFQGWTRVGTAPFVAHRGGPELVPHTYQISLDSDGRFSLVFDGNVLRSNISAGPASAWAGGIATGTLFTQSTLDDRHLSTYFDNVRALGLGGTNRPAGTGADVYFSLLRNVSADALSYNIYRAASSDGETLMDRHVTERAFTDIRQSNGTTYFEEVSQAKLAGDSGASSEVSATPWAASDLLFSDSLRS